MVRGGAFCDQRWPYSGAVTVAMQPWRRGHRGSPRRQGLLSTLLRHLGGSEAMTEMGAWAVVAVDGNEGRQWVRKGKFCRLRVT